MDRSAIFVDAGYVFASGSKLVAGEKLMRSRLHLEHDVLLTLLVRLAADLTQLPLLRIYWYDGASGAANAAQVAISYQPNVKLRLGLVTERGQEGVDELIALDLVTLARNRAITDAVLVTGDDDLRPAVEQAQELGIRVHLFGIPKARENQAAALVQAADGTHELSEEDVRSFLTLRAASATSRQR